MRVPSGGHVASCTSFTQATLPNESFVRAVGADGVDAERGEFEGAPRKEEQPRARYRRCMPLPTAFMTKTSERLSLGSPASSCQRVNTNEAAPATERALLRDAGVVEDPQHIGLARQRLRPVLATADRVLYNRSSALTKLC
jgi:hypothetical protein